MVIYHINSRRFYVTIISLLPLFKEMNCSTISIPRTATTVVTSNNGCAGTLNGCFLNSKANGTGVGTTIMAPIVNCTNGHANMHTGSSKNTTFSSNKNLNINENHDVANGIIKKISISKQSKKPELAAQIIEKSNIVCFDVDSTVIKEEGIDELANFCGKGNEVARVTKEAMGGGMTFQEALKIRLNIIQPTQQQITDFITKHPSTLTNNLKNFIEKLKADNKEVYLISGGFDCLIEPIARELSIPMTNVFANKLMFYYNGDYANFDINQPTSKSGGKAEAISIIKKKHQINGLNDVIITMIGDGATDLEAVPPANYFIGFGGNIVRTEVFKRAQYYITDFEQLM